MVVDWADIGKYYVERYGFVVEDAAVAAAPSPEAAAVQELLNRKAWDTLDRVIACAMMRELQGLRKDMAKMRTDFKEERALLRQYLLEAKKIPEPDGDGVQIVRPQR